MSLAAAWALGEEVQRFSPTLVFFRDPGCVSRGVTIGCTSRDGHPASAYVPLWAAFVCRIRIGGRVSGVYLWDVIQDEGHGEQIWRR